MTPMRAVWLRMAIVFALVAATGSAARAQGVATLGPVTGELVGRQHTFVWIAVPGAGAYYLWVNQDPDGATAVTTVHTQWYFPYEAGCAAGQAICSLTVELPAMPPGEIQWWIATGSHGSSPCGGCWSARSMLRTAGTVLRTSYNLANTFLGERAGEVSTGYYNTAVGTVALQMNTSGIENTAMGRGALRNNTTGNSNSAFGAQALFLNTSGCCNAAVGRDALRANTSGVANTAVGLSALAALTSGSYNTAIGLNAGDTLTIGSENIYIGDTVNGSPTEIGIIRIGSSFTNSGTYITGIHGKTTTAGAGVGVFVSADGKLGTIVSSARFKNDIRDLKVNRKQFMNLRPVTFYYKPELDASHTLQYGLIAEEVDKVWPELVEYGKEGEPETVKYHLLSSLMLKQLQELQRQVEELRKTVRRLEARTAK